MALTGSPLTLSSGSHSAVKFRQMLKSMLPTPGVAGALDCLVKQRVSAGQGVLVSAGGLWLQGVSSTVQGDYFDYNDADFDVAASAADGAQTRIDRVVYRVRDPDYVAGTPQGNFEWLTGTPGAGVPPTVPVDSVSLAQVARAINGNTLTNANITDERAYAVPIGAAARGWTQSGAPTSGTYSTGQYGFDINGFLMWCSAGGSPGIWANALGFRQIATRTLGGLATSWPSITIPSGLSAVLLIGNAQGNAATVDIGYQFNADTAANYSYLQIFNNGAGPSGGAAVIASSAFATQATSGSSTTWASLIVNHTGTSLTNKPVISIGSSAALAVLRAAYWNNSGASISSIVGVSSGNMISGSKLIALGIP